MGKLIGKIVKKTKDGSIKDLFRHMVWLLKYSKNNLHYIVFFTALGMVSTVVSLFSSLVSKDLVDIITGHREGELIVKFVLIIVTQLFSVLLTQVSTFFSTKISLKVTNKYKNDLYSKIMISDWERLNEFHSGALMSRWSGDSVSIVSGMLTFIPNFLTLIFRFVSSLYMVIIYDASFAIFALAGVPISMLTSRWAVGRLRDKNLESMEANTALSSLVQESFSNIQSFKAFDMLEASVKKLKEYQNKNDSTTLNYQRASIFNIIIMTLVSLFVTYSTYGWGVYKVWSGAITYGTMTMFLSLSSSLSSITQSLIGTLPQFISVSNAIKRVEDVTNLPKDDYSQTEEIKAFFEKNRETGVGVSVRDLSFAYANGTEVLENASFEASPHEVVALVGPSGEGKTTMLRLLLAIARPGSGAGYVVSGNTDGGEREEMPLTASARQLFAYVPQGNTMLSGTIAENMRNVKEDATDEEIIEALKIACAWSFVEKLPDGINTVLQERGGGMSEGQAQRLSIARAVLRKSPILLLDEATSALDIMTEKQVLKNIMQDDYPRTTIVTTHRPSVLTSCNRVYRISQKGCSVMTDAEIDELIRVFVN